MVAESDMERHCPQLKIGGFFGGHTTNQPILPGQWSEGMPCHWTEQTTQMSRKFQAMRFLGCLQIIAGIGYLSYRARETIAISAHSRWIITYQILFFIVEFLTFLGILIRYPEGWHSVRRNCIDFKHIPTDLLATEFSNAEEGDVHPDIVRYPSVGIFIPCYNEEADLVLETVLGALKVDYPPGLLFVYLCDDGKDHLKGEMIRKLQIIHPNLYYHTRPEHKHAKAGNLNYALERTHTDLIVTLDADFIARPNLLQRLVPYYFVWNPVIELYEFNENLAGVQAPQHFRNLSPYDSDPFDQRMTACFDLILPVKDYFNACPLIGTTNLLNRVALREAGYFPVHSVTEDSAMALELHRRGYQTYYVNESLASGLATTSLWSNFNQRERWIKGDWQIILSKSSPIFVSGLSFMQRIFYISMSSVRFLSIIYITYDIAAVLMLVFGIGFMDISDLPKFLLYFGTYFGLGVVIRLVRTSNADGIEKSESASGALEIVMRFTCLQGLLAALIKGRNIKFKVTEKTNPNGRKSSDEEHASNFRKNLATIWPNVLMTIIIVSAIVYGIVSRLEYSGSSQDIATEGKTGVAEIVPLALALAFAISNILPHLLLIYVCFIPYLSGWQMSDIDHGICDQYAVDPQTGKRFVPRSYISILTALQMVFIFGAMAVLVAFHYSYSNVSERST